ncbi:MAG: enoyl-CoA hydratase/isomerase family protein [Desulfuromonadales bacterium]|nr:enoyl-CoA hydratase/isomerase family protein [Desulfuromonadales bacterium]MBN2793216.1 enoyl-CoA hydratase/isomerase family protein [Desulfuromonadales bacterium]
MNYNFLLIERRNHLAIITINREKALNSLHPQTLAELENAVIDFEQNAEIKVIIITGAGQKAFVAGGDVSVMQPLNPMEAREVAVNAQRLFNAIEYSRKIYIAAINGYALGGGCELAMACDIRIAAEGAKLGQPEVKLGIIPGWGGTQRLARLVGKGKAKELMLTGNMIDAEEARQLGLVNQVSKKDELIEEALKLAEQIAEKSQVAVQLIKEAVDNGLEMDIDRAYAYEADLFGLCFASHDQKEGMLAFLEKRQPRWKDC